MPTDITLTDTDVIDRPAPLVRRGQRMLRRSVILERLGLKSAVTLWRWIGEGRFPAPVQLNPDGTLVAWYEDQVDAWIANPPHGQGTRPVEAWAERARRRQNVREGRTPKYGFVRGN
jgi:predicted DNA-binding transcriptional regulator AlpA